MKKRNIRCIILSIAAVMVLGGCGAKDGAAGVSSDAISENNVSAISGNETEESQMEDSGEEDSEGEMTIERMYLSDPALLEKMDAEVEAAKEMYANVYSDMEYGFEGNRIIYIYYMSAQVEDENIEVFRETVSGNLDAVAETVLEGLVEETGVSDVAVSYIYYNADGTELLNWSYPY